MVGLGLTTALLALPQLIVLRSGGVKTATHSLLHWGYIIEHPTLDHVIRYIGFSFGLKWGLILVALLFATWFQRRLFLALCTMYVMTFCLEMSLETLANHKYLNIWLIISNLFVAYGVLASLQDQAAMARPDYRPGRFACYRWNCFRWRD